MKLLISLCLTKKKLIIINQSNDKVFDFVKYFNETK